MSEDGGADDVAALSVAEQLERQVSKDMSEEQRAVQVRSACASPLCLCKIRSAHACSLAAGGKSSGEGFRRVREGKRVVGKEGEVQWAGEEQKKGFSM